MAAPSAIKKTSYEKIYEERLVYRKEEKHAIGKAAAAMVQEGDTIIMDTGTTTLEMARFLTDVSRLTVVTNDLGIASYLNRNSNADLLVVGGFCASILTASAGRSRFPRWRA